MRNVTSWFLLLLVCSTTASAQDPKAQRTMVYTSVLLSDLETVGGEWPNWQEGWGWVDVAGSSQAILSPPSEGFLLHRDDDAGRETTIRRSTSLVTSSPEGADIDGTLTFHESSWRHSSARAVRIRIPKKLVGNATRRDFLEAARERFRVLARSDLPGGAWFRFRLNSVEAELGAPPDAEPRRRPSIFVRRDGGGGDLEETYDFFSAGRAVSENLRLDRSLAPIEGGEPTIPVESVPGIATKAFDWKSAVEKLAPRKDPLAALIPEDQHAAFFKNIVLLEATLDALDSQLSPLATMATDRSERIDIRTQYENQLGFRLRDAWRVPGLAELVKSVAITGSDPYFATGTDVALLLETAETKAAYAVVALGQRALATLRPDATFSTGDILETPYAWLRTDDRTVSSVIASIGPAVVITNSLAQLRRIVEASSGKTPALASSPEYVFFRDRYPVRYDDETALVLLTDATIRRWCGPRWRIADARRTRAAAQLAQLTAENADAIVRGLVKPGPHAEAGAPPGLDPLSWTADTIHSGTYGSLRFLTPLLEIDVSRVTQAEAAAYEQFRMTYERRWAEFFDPIAVRFSLSSLSAAFDVTVMPLVASSEYRGLMEVTRGIRFGPTACDPHPESIVHFAMAVDAAAAAMEGWERSARRLSLNPSSLALSWLKGGVSVCLDRDPIFQQLDPERPEKRLFESLHRLPLILTAEVADPVALALFLTGVRAALEDTSVGAVRWTKVRHRDVDTMTLSGLPGPGDDDLQIRYAIVDGLLIVTLREDLLHQAIDRALDRRAGRAAESRPWRGESAAIRIDKAFVDLVAEASRATWDESQREIAWRALPILAEWHRIWPDRDPVLVHEKLFKVRLVDPAGGRYVVDADGRRIISETYGHPTETRPGPLRPRFAERVTKASGGLTFENDGVRARFAIERER